jgi:hypothetical protein
MFKYKLSPASKKYKCPGCGHKSFTPYLYSDTNELVDPASFGRCDRENSCSYHKHPTDDQLFTPSHTLSEPVAEPVAVQIYPSQHTLDIILKRTRTCVSPFHVWCKSLGIPMDHLLKWGVYTDGSNEDLTAFLFTDYKQKVCNIKWFKYSAQGRRDKEFKAFSIKQPPHTPPTKGNPAAVSVEKYFMPLFGEHLLRPIEDDRTVVLVESEKSAVLGSWFYNHFDWIACGSASGLGTGEGVPDDFKIKRLYNRRVIWLADADKAGRDNASIKKLQKYGINHCIVDLYPDKDNGYDIADDIAVGVHPDVIFREKKEEKTEEEGRYYRLPEGVEWENVKDSIMKYRMFDHEGRIYLVKGAGDSSYCKHVTNFTIKSLGHIESQDNPRRLVSIKNIHGIRKELEIPAKAFASNTEFTVFIEGEGNYQYDGASSDLKCIRSLLYDTMVTYKEVDTLGWKDGYFFFANGIYNGTFKETDQFGFVEMEKNKGYFIPALSKINKNAEEDWEDERKFVYVDRNVKMKDWADLFIKVHKHNGVITMAWFLASLFRDLIYRHFKFFPHLFLFGPPGTGKSQVGWSIRSMGFNGIKKPFNLSGGTKVAFHREFSHFCNFPAWFDEYDNGIEYDRVQSLKAAYDGAGHKKSVKDSDKRTKTVPVNSACMISGQHLPVADVALFKRVILTQFDQMEYSDQEKELFRKLQELEEGGLSHITAALMHFRKKVEDEYLTTFDQVLADFIGEYKTDVEDRILRNMCIIATMVRLLEPEIGSSLPFTYKEFRTIAIKYIRDQMSLITRSNETNVFWDMVNFLIDQGLLKEERDYMFRHKLELRVMADRNDSVTKAFDHTKPILFVRMTNVIPLYREHFKRQNSGSGNAMDKGSLINYLQQQKYYAGFVKNVKFETGEIKTASDGGKKLRSPFGAYAFDYEQMTHYGIELMRGNSEDNMRNATDDDAIDFEGSQKPPF